MNNEQHVKMLVDGVKLSIIEAFHKHINEINDLETLKKIKNELVKGEGK